MQSNKSSIYESFTQTISGVIIGFLIQKFVFPHIGIHFTNEQNIKAVVIFFFSSLIRQYLIRRIFNINFKNNMKLFFRSIKEYYWAIKILSRKQKVLEHFNYDYTKEFLNRVKSDIKTDLYKRVITKIIKKHRAPYIPIDFSAAKKFYLDFQKNNPIQSIHQIKKGDFLYVISEEYPIKGTRFTEYYINFSSCNLEDKVFQVNEIYTSRGEEDYVSSGKSNSYVNIKQCRFATADEIEAKLENDIEKSLVLATKHLFRHK